MLYDVWRCRQFSTNQRSRNYLTQTDRESTHYQALLYKQHLQKSAKLNKFQTDSHNFISKLSILTFPSLLLTRSWQTVQSWDIKIADYPLLSLTITYPPGIETGSIIIRGVQTRTENVLVEVQSVAFWHKQHGCSWLPIRRSTGNKVICGHYNYLCPFLCHICFSYKDCPIKKKPIERKLIEVANNLAKTH